jgi:phosphohistidine phosphatase SixA
MHRRDFLTKAAALCGAAGGAGIAFAKRPNEMASLLRKGGCVVVLRHAQTDPGIGDPAGYTLADCSSQRNLSIAGRQQASAIGSWFMTHSLAPRLVQSSPWCRCKDTADAAFGRHTVVAELGSTFDNDAAQDASTRALKNRLASAAAGQFDVWVTHQVNMTALTGLYPAMGEAFVVNAAGVTLMRSRFN